jgi:hypothetical protein
MSDDDGSILAFAQKLENAFESVMPDLENFRKSIDAQIELTESVLEDEKQLQGVKREDEDDIDGIRQVLGDLTSIANSADAAARSNSDPLRKLENIAGRELGSAIEMAQDLDKHQDQELKQEKDDDKVILEIRRTRESKRQLINFVQGDDFQNLVEMEEKLGEWVEGATEPGDRVAEIYRVISAETMSAAQLEEAVEEHEEKLEELIEQVEEVDESEIRLDRREADEISDLIDTVEELRQEDFVQVAKDIGQGGAELGAIESIDEELKTLETLLREAEQRKREEIEAEKKVANF